MGKKEKKKKMEQRGYEPPPAPDDPYWTRQGTDRWEGLRRQRNRDNDRDQRRRALVLRQETLNERAERRARWREQRRRDTDVYELPESTIGRTIIDTDGTVPWPRFTRPFNHEQEQEPQQEPVLLGAEHRRPEGAIPGVYWDADYNPFVYEDQRRRYLYHEQPPTERERRLQRASGYQRMWNDIRTTENRRRLRLSPYGLLHDPEGRGFGNQRQWPFNVNIAIGQPDGHYRQAVRRAIEDPRYAANWQVEARELLNDVVYPRIAERQIQGIQRSMLE